jgi:S1-C subfamily serine protease
MCLYRALFLALLLCGLGALAQAPRFIIDDDDYDGKVAEASGRLLKEGKLKSVKALRKEIQPKSYPARLAAPARRQLAAADLYDLLRQSTLVVGSYFKCPDCDQWHFNGAAGFVVGQDGVVCTCCHVVKAEDEGVTESYLVAADASGRVYPVESVLAADLESDACFVQINAPGLKPLPLRPGVRVGERVYCLSHPGGYYFMFTQGMVSRLNRRSNEAVDEQGRTNGLLTRPILLLNVTSEFAPGSSGSPITDEAGNVVGQASSIADAGEASLTNTNGPCMPSVAVRFCTAAEEILRLTRPLPGGAKDLGSVNPLAAKPKKRPRVQHN